MCDRVQTLSNLIARSVLGMIALICVGYCIYFDYLRHKDPQFKEKLKERRERERRKITREFPCPTMPKRVDDPQRYLLQEISFGEQMLSLGYVMDSVCHFANAVMICPNQCQLMAILKQTLPDDVYKKLIIRIKYLKELEQDSNREERDNKRNSRKSSRE